MPRVARYAPGGLAYHARNGAVARLPVFQEAGDEDAFQRVVLEGPGRRPVRILGYCIMPNHWHMVLWPKGDEHLYAVLCRSAWRTLVGGLAGSAAIVIAKLTG